MKKLLLTFDVEEFDLPRSLNIPFEKEQEFEISKKGLLQIKDLLQKFDIKATLFTTADFAKKYPVLIRNLSKEGHEIACHGYCHSDSCAEDINKVELAKKEIEKVIKKNVIGFRAPRFEIKDIEKLSNFGFIYDSSIYPTIAPGKYFNISKKRKVHQIGKITEIPLSTLPLFPFLRAPFNWYIFRHFPMTYGKFFTITNFSFSDYLMLIFHPWEFEDLSSYSIPKTFKKKSGEELVKKLEKYLTFVKNKKYSFDTIEKYLGLNK